MRIRQGDAYNIYISIRTIDGTPVSVVQGIADTVEINLGNLRKTCPGETFETDQFYELKQAYEGEMSNTLLTFSRDISPEEDAIIDMIGGTVCEGLEVVGITDFLTTGDVIDVERTDGGKSGKDIYVYGTVWWNETEYALIPIGSFGSAADWSGTGVILKHIPVPHFTFPLSQEETMKMSGGLPLDCRVEFSDGTVDGATLGIVAVTHSRSKEKL